MQRMNCRRSIAVDAMYPGICLAAIFSRRNDTALLRLWVDLRILVKKHLAKE
jgi:hypothetical protein